MDGPIEVGIRRQSNQGTKSASVSVEARPLALDYRSVNKTLFSSARIAAAYILDNPQRSKKRLEKFEKLHQDASGLINPGTHKKELEELEMHAKG